MRRIKEEFPGNKNGNEGVLSISSGSEEENQEFITPPTTPRKRINKQTLAKKSSTQKKIKEENETEAVADTQLTVISAKAQTTTKKNSKTPKEPPPSQLRIDKFFKSCTKSYKIELPPVTTSIKADKISIASKTDKKSKTTRKSATRGKKTHSTVARRGRKRLFNSAEDDSTTSVSTISGFRDMTPSPKKHKRKRASTEKSARGDVKLANGGDLLKEFINLCSDDDGEKELNKSLLIKREKLTQAEESPHLPSAKRSVSDNNSNISVETKYQSQPDTNPLKDMPHTSSKSKISNITDYDEMPCTSSYSAHKRLESSVMVAIPVQQKSNRNGNAKSKVNADNKQQNNSRGVSNPSILANVAQSTKDEIPKLWENEGLQTKSDMQIKLEPGTSRALQFGQSPAKNCLQSTPRSAQRVKIEHDTETLVATPPSPPQTSTDTYASDHGSSSATLTNTLLPLQTKEPSSSSSTVKGGAPSSSTVKGGAGGRVKKVRVCPPYKIVAGTTFAVDAFLYGQIEGVTHYFLTHFHADHYQGLTRKFAMPIYVSPLTARLVRALIPVEEQYLHEIELNVPVWINGVEVTAIDANHCPGAVMFVFKLPTGRCLLHTGDFRASADMESEPIFWNKVIDTIYLDTTYIAQRRNFCKQFESIDRAKSIIEEFRAKRPSERVLYICGSYVIGKERFWTSLAHAFGLKVWTERNRLKALQVMDLEDVRGLLCDDPYEAQMHVISIGKVSYHALVDYFRPFQSNYDAVLAFRPSGWEKNSKLPLHGKINVVGIEYSEHSSHAELERFVTYLKPREVISTVPVMQGNLCITPKIPEKWYKYDSLKSRKRNFQPSITSFMTKRPKQLGHGNNTKRRTNCVTPTKSPSCKHNDLSQLSIRAMATCNELQLNNDGDGDDDTDDDVVAVGMDMAMQNSKAVVTLFPDMDASDDWIS